MNIKNIEIELCKIQSLVSRWSDQGYVPQIEKNIALQRVQKFYELFLELDTQAQIEYHSEPIITPAPAQKSEQQAEHDDQNPETKQNDNVVEFIEVEKHPRAAEAPKQQQFSIFGVEISAEQKARFTHDLFCNDPLVFHNEISKMERLHSLDEVLIYIGEKYAWAPDNLSADEFVELIAGQF